MVESGLIISCGVVLVATSALMNGLVLHRADISECMVAMPAIVKHFNILKRAVRY